MEVGSIKRRFLGSQHTICEKLYTSDIETTVLAIVDEVGNLGAPVALRGGTAHDVETVLSGI